VTVLECDNPEAPTEVLVCERQPKDGDVFEQLPFALTPGPADQHQAIAGVHRDHCCRRRGGPARAAPDAVTDVLLRRAPRTISGDPLPRGDDVADDIKKALLDLDSSYLAVHGPPGTGKTFTTAKVIERLVNAHGGESEWSHSRTRWSRTCSPTSSAQAWTGRWWPRSSTPNAGAGPEITNRSSPLHRRTRRLRRRGTAWDFANDNKIPRLSLDLLVVEEAGQFSLANTIAVAPSARNLMLLGDRSSCRR